MPNLVRIDAPTKNVPGTAGARGSRPASEVQGTMPFAAPNADAEIRERALDASKSFVIEAPAGSGKTGLLIQRFLLLLADPDVQSPDQVLAITFTKAATEEIRARILKELEAAHADPTGGAPGFEAKTRSLAAAVLARDHALGWHLLDEPQQLRIRTIDAVCSEIVRLLPVMSGGGATLKPTEQPRALHAQAARRTVLQLGEKGEALSDALEVLLLHRNGNLGGCVDLIAEMLAVREQWGGLLPGGLRTITDEELDRVVRPALDRALGQAVCSELTRIERAIPADLLSELAKAAATMSERSGSEDGVSPLACCAGRQAAPQAIGEHLEHWQALAGLVVTKGGTWRRKLDAGTLGFQLSAADKPRLRSVLEQLDANDEARVAFCTISELPPARYDDHQWSVLRALFRILERALIELKLVFAETGECDFAELALLARSALAHGEGARAYDLAMGSELRHLLVDEMQDTSTGQYTLLEMLTAGWSGEGRTIFLVGDPKQSIYLFRQARVERFVETMHQGRLGETELEVLRLSTNFRSQPALVASANVTFRQIFPASSAGGAEIPYTEAEAFRRSESQPPAGEVWHAALVSTKPSERRSAKRASVRRHAEEIRRIVLEWRKKPLPPGRTEPWRIGVLVASRHELKPVVAALKRDGPDGPVPFRALKVEQLAEQAEILDLLALTRALRHLADRVAWLAVLRAPCCGLSLSDLHQLAGADDARFAKRSLFPLLWERFDRLSADGQARLEPVRSVFEIAVEQSGRLPLPELVESTWRALGANTYLDAPAIQNTEQFFALLDTVHDHGGEDVIAVLESRMERLFAAPNPMDNAVELMTIHGAKGLEWDVVLIPELDRRAPPTRGRLLEWEEIAPPDENTAGVIFAPIKDATEEEWALNAWLRGMRTRRLSAERKRLFYVACTRAREELHLFASADLHGSGSRTAPASSLLEAAWPSVAARFADASVPIVERRVLPFPQGDGQNDSDRLHGTLAIAAAAEHDGGEPDVADEAEMDALDARTGPVMLSRLPLAALRALHAGGASLEAFQMSVSNETFSRPEGSLVARSRGNAVHAFLDMAARRIAQGQTPPQLLREIAGWHDRIRAVLRNDGLAAKDVARLTHDVETALRKTIAHPVGRWILAARADAQSEYALTTARAAATHLRLDRMFRAGSAPEADGESHLWIVDFKTASPKDGDLDGWLEAEKTKYQGQMTAYASIFPEEQVNLALWYPLLERLVWWPAGV